MRYTEQAFNKMMESSHAKVRNCSKLSTSHLESAVSSKPMEKEENKRFVAPVDITVHSFRYRLCDSDGISAKAVIDQIVKEGILADDSADCVQEVRFKQTKIKKPEEEKTVILIEECE